MNTDKILDDAREKLARNIQYTLYGADIIIGDDVSREIAGQILALSGTTDLECPECKGKGYGSITWGNLEHTKVLGKSGCPRCGRTGVIKHKWKVSVVLENGELPEDIKNYDQDIADIIIGAGYRQVVKLP